jgi:membrane protein required for colicin V production
LSWIDVILLLILSVTVFLGIVKGFVKQIFGLLAVIIGLILALNCYSQVAWLYRRLITHEVLAHFLGFITVFFAVLSLGWIVSHLLSKLVRGPLKLLDKVLGGALGLLKGILICGVIVFALLVFPIDKRALKGSLVSPVCLKLTRTIVSLIPKELKEKFKEAYKEITKRVGKDGKRI